MNKAKIRVNFITPKSICVSASHRRCASASLREKNEDNSVKITFRLDTLRAEIQKSEIFYNKKIVDLEGLKKSILHKTFAGELI